MFRIIVMSAERNTSPTLSLTKAMKTPERKPTKEEVAMLYCEELIKGTPRMTAEEAATYRAGFRAALMYMKERQK